MNLDREGVVEARQKFAITKDSTDGPKLYECDECDFTIVSERSVLMCPECDGECRIAPHSRQP
jgi:Zn finger protein HypA/HybF involved in hydrogenase expression